MFGKHFSSTYEGSMIGAGSHVFAVWGYVIAKQRPDRKVGSTVELNAKLLAAVIGDSEERMTEAIEYLCDVDEESRTSENDGRRLVRLGQFTYQVVNGAKYRAIRNDDERRVQTREAVRRHRAKKAGPGPGINGGTPLPGERAFVAAERRGDYEGAAAIAAAGLPGAGVSISEPSEPSEPSSEELKMDITPMTVTHIGSPLPETQPSCKPLQGSEEPPTESGRMVDGEWVPD